MQAEVTATLPKEVILSQRLLITALTQKDKRDYELRSRAEVPELQISDPSVDICSRGIGLDEIIPHINRTLLPGFYLRENDLKKVWASGVKLRTSSGPVPAPPPSLAV